MKKQRQTNASAAHKEEKRSAQTVKPVEKAAASATHEQTKKQVVLSASEHISEHTNDGQTLTQNTGSRSRMTRRQKDALRAGQRRRAVVENIQLRAFRRCLARWTWFYALFGALIAEAALTLGVMIWELNLTQSNWLVDVLDFIVTFRLFPMLCQFALYGVVAYAIVKLGTRGARLQIAVLFVQSTLLFLLRAAEELLSGAAMYDVAFNFDLFREFGAYMLQNVGYWILGLISFWIPAFVLVCLCIYLAQEYRAGKRGSINETKYNLTLHDTETVKSAQPACTADKQKQPITKTTQPKVETRLNRITKNNETGTNNKKSTNKKKNPMPAICLWTTITQTLLAFAELLPQSITTFWNNGSFFANAGELISYFIPYLALLCVGMAGYFLMLGVTKQFGRALHRIRLRYPMPLIDTEVDDTKNRETTK